MRSVLGCLRTRVTFFKPANIRRFFVIRRKFRWGVRQQIGVLGALGVIGVLALGGIDFAGNLEQERLQQETDRISALGHEIHKLAESVMAVRQLDLDFLRRPDEASIARRQAAGTEATAHLESVNKLAADAGDALDEDLVRAIKAVGSTLRAYFTEFNNVVAMQRTFGFDEDHGLQGKFRDAVHAVEALLAERGEPRVENLMLKMRGDERDFLLHGDSKIATEMKKNATDFDEALSASPIFTADDKKAVAGRMSEYQRGFAILMNARASLDEEVRDLSDGYRAAGPVVSKLEAAVDELSAMTQQSFAVSRAATAMRMRFALGIITVAVALVAWTLAHRISKSIVTLTSAMKRLAAGDVSLEMPVATRRDELGDMTLALAAFQENAVHALELEEEKKREQASREIRHRELETLTQDFSVSAGEIAKTIAAQVGAMETSTHVMSRAAEAANGRAESVAGSAETASENVGAVASAAGQMSASIDRIANQLASAVEIARDAVERSDQTNQTIGSLAATAESIGGVLTLIQKIAAQTNLLALNATIEAARAGEAGRGFAVVAGEVKVLAAQTDQATKDIAAQMTAIRGASGNAVQAIAGIGEAIRKVDAIAASIAEAVREQAGATREIAQKVNDAAVGTRDVSSAIVGVTSASAEVRTATGTLQGVARTLSQQVERLRGQVDGFVAAVQAS